MSVDRDRVAAALPRYDIQAEIGRGAWGVVLSAEHRELGRRVAVKQLPVAFARDPLVQRRFTVEARLLASLDHPHIVPIFDYVVDDGLSLLVMELLPGGTVRDRFTTMGIAAPEACSITLATCAALHYAHGQGILHRDIKPENLLFNAAGTLKVTDFGIAKVLGGAETLVTQAGNILGTPAYMAPEQVMAAPLSPATDVYAVATMLYELLSGQLPFSDEGGVISALYRHAYEQPAPLLAAAPHTPAALADAVMSALATDPTARPPSAEDFGVAVAGAANEAWGPGWLLATGADVVVSRRVAQRISDPGGPPAPERVMGLAKWLEKGGPPLPPSSLPSRPSSSTPALEPAAGADVTMGETAAPRSQLGPSLPAAQSVPNQPATPTAPDRPEPSAPPPRPVTGRAPSASRRPRRRRGVAAAGIGAVVVAVVVVAAVILTRSPATKLPPPPATSTTAAAATATPVFTDNFSDSASGWAPDSGQGQNGTTEYRPDGFYVTVATPLPMLNTFSAASPYTTKLMAMAISVHVTFVTAVATDGAAVRCDQGSRMGLRYTFQVSPNGNWVLFKTDDSGPTALQTGTVAAAPPGVGYTLGGRCVETAGGATTLGMTIDGTQVATVTDVHGGAPIGWNAALTAYRGMGSPGTVVRFNSFETEELRTS